MPGLRGPTLRSVLLVAATVLVAAVPAPASAVSPDLDYRCTTDGVPTQDGVVASASWDTAVTEGLTVRVGDEVTIGPVTGTVTIPAAFVDQLREKGFSHLGGEGGATIRVDETGEEWAPVFAVDAVPLPQSGPAALTVSGILDPAGGATDPVTVSRPGTHTLEVTHFGITFGMGYQGPEAGLSCSLQDTEDTTTDRFTVLPAAPMPPTPVEPTTLTYECVYRDPADTTQVGHGTVVASVDTAIPEGLVVPVGTQVPIDPFVGSLTFPTSLMDRFRSAGDTSLFLFSESLIVIPETGDDHPVQFWFHPDRDVVVPPAGQFTAGVRGDGEAVDTTRAGTYTLTMPRLDLMLQGHHELTPPFTPSLGLRLQCDLAAGQDAAIDSFRAGDSSTPSAEPVRPVLVQTDFAGPPTAPGIAGSRRMLAAAAVVG